MKTFTVYSDQELKGTVKAVNSNEALVIAKTTYGDNVTSVHETAPMLGAPVPMLDKPKEYFLELVQYHFKKMKLSDVNWNLLSKKDLYNIYLWIYENQ
jgi:hypothetical protein